MRDNEASARKFAKSLRRHMTEAETILWSRLRTWRDGACIFRRQHPIGPYIADFACVKSKLIIELDGEQHGDAVHRPHDLRRDAFLQRHGWRVIRIPNEQVYTKLGEVLDRIGDLRSPLRLAAPAAIHLPRYPDTVRRHRLSTAGEERFSGI